MPSLQKMWVVSNLFLDISQRSERDIRSQRWRRGNAPRKHGTRCSCRDTGSLATRSDPDRDTHKRAGARGSYGQLGAKHPATVSHTDAENEVNDANNADALRCSATWYIP